MGGRLDIAPVWGVLLLLVGTAWAPTASGYSDRDNPVSGLRAPVAAPTFPAVPLTLDAFEREADALSKTAIRSIGVEKRRALVERWTQMLQAIARSFPRFQEAQRKPWVEAVARAVPHVARLSSASVLDNGTGDDVTRATATEPIVAALRTIDPSRKTENPYSRALSEELLPKSPVPRKEACSAICKTLETLPQWGYDGSRVSHRWRDGSTISSNGDWNFALYALEALFALEAAPLCPEAKDLDKTLKHVLERWASSQKLQPNSVFLGGKFGAYGLHFASLIFSRLPELARESRAVRDALPDSLAEDKLPDLAKLTRERLGRIVDQYRNLEFGLGGSNLEMHSLSVMLTSLRERGHAVASAIGEAYQFGRYPDCVVPYSVQQMVAWRERNYSMTGGNDRESSARCVAFWFGQVMANQDSPAKREKLLMALENYVLHSGSLLSTVPRSGFHGGVDNLAPYYLPPTTIVATAAARLLANAPGEKDRERIEKVLDMTTRASMAAYRGNGTWITPASVSFTDASATNQEDLSLFGKGGASFGTALPALSLVPACRADGSLGAYQGVAPQPLQMASASQPRAPEDGRQALAAHESPRGNTTSGRTRSSETRSREESLAASVRDVLPAEEGDVPAALTRLRESDRIPALATVFADNSRRAEFLRALGLDPTDPLVQKLEEGLRSEMSAIERLRSDPSSELNAPWRALLGTAAFPSEADAERHLDKLPSARQWLSSKDTTDRAKANAWADQLAATLPPEARAPLAERLRRFVPPTGTSVPPGDRQADAELARILLRSLESAEPRTAGRSIATRGR